MRKAVSIEMDKIRNLRFGTNAISMAEDLLGRPITAIGTSVGIKDLRVLYYCGLYWEDKELTLDDVGDLMDIVMEEQGTEYLGNKIAEAIQQALPDPKKKAKKAEK